MTADTTTPDVSRVLGPFRRAVLRGLGAFLAPLLTVVILVWVWQTLKVYLLEPVTQVAREVLVRNLVEVYDEPPAEAIAKPDNPKKWTLQGREFIQLDDGQSLPVEVVETVVNNSGGNLPPLAAREYYRRYIDSRYLAGWIVNPIILLVFLGVMYLLGTLFAADATRMLWNLFEFLVQRVPLIRAVYTPVKQVVNYLLDSGQPRFSRVVAVEYPRHGVWTLAFVTGEGFADIEAITGEPMLTILFPTCPMPVTGNTKFVARREVLDLPITTEQAARYVVSFGVVIDESAARVGKLKPAGEITLLEDQKNSDSAGNSSPSRLE